MAIAIFPPTLSPATVNVLRFMKRVFKLQLVSVYCPFIISQICDSTKKHCSMAIGYLASGERVYSGNTISELVRAASSQTSFSWVWKLPNNQPAP